MISAKPALIDPQRPRKLSAPQAPPEYDRYEIAPANMALRYYLLTDICALLVAFAMASLLAMHVNFYYFGRTLFDAATKHSAFAASCAMIAAGLLFWFAHRQHYAQRLTFWTEFRHVALGAGFCALLLSFLQLLNHAEYSRLWLLGVWGFAAVFIMLGRMGLRQILRQTGQWSIPALYIGHGMDSCDQSTTLHTCHELGFHIHADIDEAVIAARLQVGESWGSILASYDVGAVLMRCKAAAMSCDLWAMQWARLRIPFAIVTTRPKPLVTLIRRGLPKFGKRLFDLTGSAAAIFVLSPLFLIMALLIKRDGGPVFHADTRVGIDGKLIKCLKFRSMIVNADQELVRYLRSNPRAAAEWAQYQKLREDPRITAVGRFIRKTSLDELPQLINVFWGEMTLVGPRPIIPNQKLAYGPNISYYHTVRPGITGLWQVSGRNRLTFRQRAKLDRWYVRHWSLWLDIVILFRTLPVLLLRKDAY